MPRMSTWFSQNGAKCAAIALLAMPTVLPLFIGGQQANENRRLAPPPDFPEDWAQFLALPAKTDAWVKDHFGFRKELVEANNALRFAALREFPSVQTSAGENGRLFVTAHASTAPPYSAVVEICDVNQQALKEFGTYLNILFEGFNALGYSPKLMIVPSAPTVQSADLPHWLRGRCNSDKTPMATLLQSSFISQDVKTATYYPLVEMRSRARANDLFPKTWFHWNGSGIEAVVQGSMQRLFPAVKSDAPRLITHSSTQQSDVQQMFPGLALTSTVTEPDYAASHIKSCYGATCFPEFKGFEDLLYDASRFYNPAAPDRRLLILSDSFGRFAAGWYTRHYRTVEHVAVNNVRELKREQVKTLSDAILREPAKTDLLFLFHDGALTGTLRLGLQRFHRNGEGGLQEMHNPSDYSTVAQQLYVTYLGRPADINGLRSVQRQLAEAAAPIDLQQLDLTYADSASVRELVDSLGKSAESQELYAGSTRDFIGAIYRHTFNRQPDAGGLDYWADQIDKGQLTRERAVLAISAASLVGQTRQGQLDGALLRKKVAYSTMFTESLLGAKRQCYGGTAAAWKARVRVAAVKIDTDVNHARIAAAKMTDTACE